jgi:hypothetical protein
MLAFLWQIEVSNTSLSENGRCTVGFLGSTSWLGAEHQDSFVRTFETLLVLSELCCRSLCIVL